MVVCVTASDLKVKGSGSQPTPGDEVSVHLGHDVELFDLALNAEYGNNDSKGNLSENATNVNDVENDLCTETAAA